MRKGVISLTAASLLATAFVAATPVLDTPAPADDVTVVGEAILAAPTTTAALAAATATVDCTDTVYALEKWHLAGTYNWSYNPAGAPAAVSASAATTMYRATSNVVTGQSRCGTTRSLLGISQSYGGSSTRVAQVSATAACTGNDGVSVTSWGVLPTNTLGYTCTYYKTSTGAVTSSDMLLNSTKKWFVGTVPAGCTDSFDLESVVAHERGHTAGLSHVDQTLHPQQTMSPRTLACTTYKRLFGGGDLKGLEALSAIR